MLTIRREGRLVGLVPLVTTRERHGGVPARVLAFAGEPLADRLGFLVEDADPEAAEVVSRAIVEEARDVDLVRLTEMEAHGPAERALGRVIRASGATYARRACARAPVLRLDSPWEDVARGFGRSLRTRLRRARRRQESAGAFTFARWQPEPDELPHVLGRFRDLESRSWKGDRGVGVFGPPERWAFMNEMALAFARRGWLDVATLENGGNLVAYRFGFRFRGAFLDFNLAHAPEAAEFSPGRTLLDDIVRDSHRIGLQ
ncbi:GNAT family N-acetyltransferase, partial [bacterium]|nr:GNAT family N-acetyltransferase [bacterium]